jgi:hypothetical protein
VNSCAAPLCLVFWPMLVLTLATQGAKAGATAERFSTLTDGQFERQLERPVLKPLTPGTPEMAAALKHFEALPFDVGERLRFDITYLGIRGGSAEIVVQHPVKVGNGWAMRVTGEVVSAAWYAWITRVHDAIEAVFDPRAGYRPIQFYMNQQESRYFNSKILKFDFAQGKVFQTSKRKDRQPKDEAFDLQTATVDAAGALYYLRQNVGQMERSATLEVPIFTSEKTWTGRVKHLRSENRKVLGQSMPTDVYALDTQFGGLIQQEGDIRIWFTQDTRRLPVYVQADVAFGYIEVDLAEWDQGYPNGTVKTLYPPLRRPGTASGPGAEAAMPPSSSPAPSHPEPLRAKP